MGQGLGGMMSILPDHHQAAGYGRHKALFTTANARPDIPVT